MMRIISEDSLIRDMGDGKALAHAMLHNGQRVTFAPDRHDPYAAARKFSAIASQRVVDDLMWADG